ncbi:MauE/DoxX family redox-associated membrane protein [Labedaea rhizosphaerae]|uniref:Methylamine utilisation protein MauE domain-containing protein n=1 Tax=Labedaea rhizosphaerae TaxID=598644 RepID=A0A4R6SDT7_LABRH|nr:MauE/DoxX family redox-associated membrane protein [Labedaea rhizosphaerae]TDP97275.1 hypothetical protein EV186_103238 [Labedaea rhizosphaerae]
MLQTLAALAPLPVGVLLLLASRVKLLGKNTPEVARRSALRKLVGDERVVGAYRAVGAGELVLGALLVLPPSSVVEAAVATAACAGLLGYLGYARLKAPDSSCGCLSEKVAPVRWRSFARAALMLVTAAVALGAPGYWLGAIADRPLATVGLLAGWFALASALSAELDGYWLVPLRRLRVRLSHPLGKFVPGIPLESTMDILYRSAEYRSAVGLIRSDVLEWWDEGTWRIVTFAARNGDEHGTAVFAVPLAGDGEIKAVLVPADEPVAA